MVVISPSFNGREQMAADGVNGRVLMQLGNIIFPSLNGRESVAAHARGTKDLVPVNPF